LYYGPGTVAHIDCSGTTILLFLLARRFFEEHRSNKNNKKEHQQDEYRYRISSWSKNWFLNVARRAQNAVSWEEDATRKLPTNIVISHTWVGSKFRFVRT